MAEAAAEVDGGDVTNWEGLAEPEPEPEQEPGAEADSGGGSRPMTPEQGLGDAPHAVGEDGIVVENRDLV
eukprot:COSAG02_NODE_38588_length_427_cov_0.945122_1_plen_69_part_01